MFERFTQSARDVVVGATTEAKDQHRGYVGTEHLLLAMLADPTGPIATALQGSGVDHARVRADIDRLVGPAEQAGPAPDTEAEDAAALKAIGIDLTAVRKAIEENFGPGALELARDEPPKRRGFLRRPSGSGRRPFTPRSKKVLELSLREAVRLRHNEITVEHLMLGLLREGDGVGARILAEAGVDFDGLRTELTRKLPGKAA